MSIQKDKDKQRKKAEARRAKAKTKRVFQANKWTWKRPKKKGWIGRNGWIVPPGLKDLKEIEE